ncbi:hypothetical protein PUNSTDRAFT_135974 [Punctularia strigosozonata HHB-11173 SS5]|uniref:uncharacterized protein n=1 Tax=Punctularia strigosozonata (strain HHB-11173) TaxID=741275 RepID=UPI00044184A5|nr:uncharacterized protein PUNSTDRAFT_135974 [Punctularia strigosozonata HHB-11173 SS5]EIN07288.1 hypothetical protein PUNSTDRAFT_135974 [Punctularia strigosozonata HHB-11173 SS5]
MGSWVLESGTELPNRSYSRELGQTELGFYWDAAFNRTADTTQHVHLKLSPEAIKRNICGPDHIRRTWVALKQRYPLLAARFDDRDVHVNGRVWFVVEEQRLRDVGTDELVFKTVNTLDDCDVVIDAILNDDPPLTNDMLAQVVVMHRTDDPDSIHVVFNVAHAITDGMANATVSRTFFELLCSADDVLSEAQSLPERLAMAVCSESLDPGLRMTKARRRWRLAISRVIWEKRQDKMKGGHSLPNRLSPSSWLTPAQSRLIGTSFDPATSKSIIHGCRQKGITFGHAFPVLGQVAAARVLHRRYLRGEITDEEMQYRLRQPMHTGGPLNLRPYLDPAWFEHGGATEVCLCISFFWTTLPFLPRPPGTRSRKDASVVLHDGAPTVFELLPSDRFLLRARSIKRQVTMQMKHPSFLEIILARLPSRIDRMRSAVTEWRTLKAAGTDPRTLYTDRPIDVSTLQDGLVLTHGGSSMGNVDVIQPLSYPLSKSHPLSIFGSRGREKQVPAFTQTVAPHKAAQSDNGVTVERPLLEVLLHRTHLHCRPGELYLGSTTSRGQLHMHIFWDENVYDESVVTEWLHEVKQAAEHYLPDSPRGPDIPRSKL